MLSVPGGTLVGCPGGCGCCSPEWDKSLVETCGLAACWVEWVLTGDLSGTRTEAVGQTGRSERKEHGVRRFVTITVSQRRESAPLDLTIQQIQCVCRFIGLYCEN